MTHSTYYRKYRSQNFSALVGQEQIVRTLQNSLSSGKIAHAYLFTGPRGTGKTSTARIYAKALNCEKSNDAEPCNQCATCTSITQGSCMDVIEMDAASDSSVDDVREAIVQVTEYKPTTCRYKVFIIDEVHDLSAKAFDAILKTIEEPPEHVIFILATTEYHKVPPTIRSRCQKFEFHRANIAELNKCLAHVLNSESIEYEPSALLTIARMADGSYRDALTLLERVMITAENKLTQAHIDNQLGLINEETLDQLLIALKEENVTQLLHLYDEVYHRGRESRALLEALLSRITELTRVLYGATSTISVDAPITASLRATSITLGKEFLFSIRDLLTEAHKVIREITLPKVWLEAELVNFCERNLQPKRSEPKQPRITEEPSAKAFQQPVEPKSEPKNTTSSQTGQEEASPHQKIWHQVVINLSKISKLAEVKLSKTEILKADENTIIVGFERQLDLKWVINNTKIQAAIQKEWASIAGLNEIVIEYQPNPHAKKKNPFNPDPVELPKVGEKLAEVAHEVFEGF